MNPNHKRLGCFALLLTVLCSSHSLLAQMNGAAARDWPVVFRDTLQHSVLQFWIDHAVDKESGGLLGQLNRLGEPTGSGDKSVVLISRSLWSFSEAYRRYPDPAYQKMATECLKFLREKMWDKEHGGYYFMVTREGKVVDSTKQLNPMSYVMEGLAEYALAFHDNQSAREALDLFQVIDRHAHDDKYGGYRIAFTADWQFIKDYKDGPNGAGSFGRKSYDWHLGLVEALATLYDVTGDSQVRARLEELLNLFVNRIIDADIGYGRYYFHDDWSVADRDGDSKESEYGSGSGGQLADCRSGRSAWDGSRTPAFAGPAWRLSIMPCAMALTKSTEASTATVPRLSLRKTRTWNGGNSARPWLPCSTLTNSRETRSTGKPSICRLASSWSALRTINTARSTPPFFMMEESMMRRSARGKLRTMSPAPAWRLSRDWEARCSRDAP